MEILPHICFVSDTIHSYFESGIESGTGGAERQQYLLINELLELGYEISIATLDCSHALTTHKNVKIWKVIPDVRGVTLAPYKAIQTIHGLRKIGADIYYVRGNDFLSILTSIYTTLSDSKFIYAIANDSNITPSNYNKSKLLFSVYIKSISSAIKVIAQTESQKHILQDHFGISSTVIPNGYPMPPQDCVVPSNERKYVLWVGSMDPTQKKPMRFINLAKNLPHLDFVMIGPPDNDNPEYFQHVQRESANVSNLRFLGYKNPDEIHTYYRYASVVVNTSDYEGFPNVYLEAWRFATPIISLYHDFDNLIESEPIGIYAGSEEKLIASTEKIATNAECQHELGWAAREYMEENFSIKQLTDSYHQTIKNLAEL